MQASVVGGESERPDRGAEEIPQIPVRLQKQLPLKRLGRTHVHVQLHMVPRQIGIRQREGRGGGIGRRGNPFGGEVLGEGFGGGGAGGGEGVGDEDVDVAVCGLVGGWEGGLGAVVEGGEVGEEVGGEGAVGLGGHAGGEEGGGAGGEGFAAHFCSDCWLVGWLVGYFGFGGFGRKALAMTWDGMVEMQIGVKKAQILAAGPRGFE